MHGCGLKAIGCIRKKLKTSLSPVTWQSVRRCAVWPQHRQCCIHAVSREVSHRLQCHTAHLQTQMLALATHDDLHAAISWQQQQAEEQQQQQQHYLVGQEPAAHRWLPLQLARL